MNWISVKDEMPQGERSVVYFEFDEVTFGVGEDGRILREDRSDAKYATHWMYKDDIPLPSEKDLVALEAKANAFDALEGLVKERNNGIHLCNHTYIPIEPGDTGIVYEVTFLDQDDMAKGSFGGPDLQSAINDAVHGGGGE